MHNAESVVFTNTIKSETSIRNSWESGHKKLIEPRTYKAQKDKKIPVVVLISSLDGALLLEHLFSQPELDVVLVCTDNTTDPNARISKKKRLWKAFSSEEQAEMEQTIVDISLQHSTPVYLGCVNNSYCRRLLTSLGFGKKNGLAIMSTFGQLLGKEFLDSFHYGVINLHPSDLSHEITNSEGERKPEGAGTTSDILSEAQRNWVPLTAIYADEGFDTGQVIAQKGQIPIAHQSGERFSVREFEMEIARHVNSCHIPLVDEITTYIANKRSQLVFGRIPYGSLLQR